MFSNKSVYAFVPVGVALVAGGIQTAAIVASFTAAQWHIAGILILCVWLTVAMDAAAFHHSVINGANRRQMTFLWISAVSLVAVLAIDMVILISPSAFNTTDEIVRNLHYAPGVNLAISTFCLLGWFFFDEGFKEERSANTDELALIHEQRMEYLNSEEAKELYGDMVRQDYLGRVASRRGIRKPNEPKVINQPTTQHVPSPLDGLSKEDVALLQAMLKTGGHQNGGVQPPKA